VRLSRAAIVHGDGPFTWDDARRISPGRERKEPYPLRVSFVEKIGILADSAPPFTDPALLPEDAKGAAVEFAATVNRRLARSENRDIVIYVHGYKVPFEAPLLVATELWHFMGYDGVFIPFLAVHTSHLGLLLRRRDHVAQRTLPAVVHLLREARSEVACRMVELTDKALDVVEQTLEHPYDRSLKLRAAIARLQISGIGCAMSTRTTRSAIDQAAEAGDCAEKGLSHARKMD